ASRQDQTSIWGTRKSGDILLNLPSITHVDHAHIHSDRGRNGLDHGELSDPGSLGGIPKDTHPRYAWGDLLEQLHPFCGQCILKCNKTSCVATRSSQAVDVTAANWIDDTVEYDRHRVRHSQQRFQPELAGYHDNVRWKCDQFFRGSPSLRRITARPSDFNPHIVAVDPAQLMQDVQEYRDTSLLVRLDCRAHEHANTPHAPVMLPARRERPRGRTAEKRDERAALHSITSSARCWRIQGTSRPSVLAVLRLITSSNLTGAWTGSSLGCAPLRMRSA